VLAREIKGAPGDRERVVRVAGQKVRLPEVGEEERMVAGAGRRGVSQRLLQEDDALEEPTAQRVGVAKVPGCDVEQNRDWGGPA
jgi:hypothetical protein